MIRCTFYNQKTMTPFSIKSLKKLPRRGKKIKIFGRLWKIITIFNDFANFRNAYHVYVEEI